MVQPAPKPKRKRISWDERKRRGLAAKEGAEREKVRLIFLGVLAKGLSVSAAAREAGKDASYFKAWRATDTAFAQQWDDAVEQGTDSVEDQVLRRAVLGWDEPVFHHGKQVGTKRVYDSTLAIVLLNGRRPEKYKRVSTASLAKAEAKESGADDQRERIMAKLRAVASPTKGKAIKAR